MMMAENLNGLLLFVLTKNFSRRLLHKVLTVFTFSVRTVRLALPQLKIRTRFRCGHLEQKSD